MTSLVRPENTKSAAVALRLGARRDGEFTHVRHGHMHIYRHPTPEELT